jgi:hypothetical protein
LRLQDFCMFRFADPVTISLESKRVAVVWKCVTPWNKVGLDEA